MFSPRTPKRLGGVSFFSARTPKSLGGFTCFSPRTFQNVVGVACFNPRTPKSYGRVAFFSPRPNLQALVLGGRPDRPARSVAPPQPTPPLFRDPDRSWGG